MKYRENLPQLNGHDMTTTGAMETWLQYVDGFELQHFCFFDLLNNPKAVVALRDFHRKSIEAVMASVPWSKVCIIVPAEIGAN